MPWRDCIDALPPGRALDLACGAGSNARWLAARGWQVVAVDWGAPAIAGLQGVANIDARLMDLEREPIDALGAFDLMVVWRYYQPSLFDAMRAQLRAGGVLAISTKLTGRFAACLAELLVAFEGWSVLWAVECDGFAELVVRKIGGHRSLRNICCSGATTCALTRLVQPASRHRLVLRRPHAVVVSGASQLSEKGWVCFPK